MDIALLFVVNCKSDIIIDKSSIVETGLQHIFHIFPHFHTFFHIFPSLPLHFPNSCHKLHCSKEKMRLPKTLLMDTLILNLKQMVSESSKEAVPQNILPKLSLQKNLKKRQNNPCWDS